MAFCYAIITSIASTARKFRDYLTIKRITKYTTFSTVSKATQIKIEKGLPSISVIIKRDKPISSPDFTFKWFYVLG